MRSIYSIGVDFASHGIGTIAYHAAKGLYNANVLKKILCMSHKKSDIPESIITDVLPGGRFSEKALIGAAKLLGSVNGYGAKDSVYDHLASRHIENCDIFHGWALQAVKSLRIAKNNGALSVLERPNTHILSQKELLEGEYLRRGLKRVCVENIEIERNLEGYDLADYIITPSGFARKSFEDRGFDAKKIIMIPYGYDDRRFMPLPRKDNIFRVIFAGQVSLRKGVPYLLEAWEKLKIEDAELVLIGKVLPEMKEEIISCTKKIKNLIVKEFVPYGEISFEYNNASIFVFPSLEDGFALVVLEAMACGLPVIVSENTGAKDIVRAGIDGFITPIRDPNAIAERIQYFYDNREKLEEMGRAASENAKEFTWDRYAENLIKAYKLILKGKTFL